MLVMDKEIKVNIETGLNTDCEFTFLGTVASDKAYICGQRWMKWTLIFTCPRELGLNWQICQAFPSTNTTKLFPVTLVPGSLEAQAVCGQGLARLCAGSRAQSNQLFMQKGGQ